MAQTTPGKILLKRALPEKYHPFIEQGPLTSDRIDDLMDRVMAEKPEDYKDILQELHNIGEEVSRAHGGQASLSPSSFLPNEDLATARAKIEEKLNSIWQQEDTPIKEKEQQTVDFLSSVKSEVEDLVKKNLEGTSLGAQMNSGVRGGTDEAMALLTGELVPEDEEGNPVPIPVTRGFAEGLTPSQYWATAQKARTGLIGVKLATPEAGDISNQLMQAVSRLRVTRPKEPRAKHGLPINPHDPDYEGSILAQDIPDVAQEGDKLTPAVIRDLKDKGINRVMIHSPITSQVGKGISKESAGSALGGPFPIGSFAGIQASQGLSEPFTQSSISSKHSGQRAGAGLGAVRQLIEVPSSFPGGAAIAENPGRVTGIKESDSGGKIIETTQEEHHLAPGLEPKVEKGDQVKIGQVLSSGMPNPAKLTKLLGIGEGRRRFMNILSDTFKKSGIPHNKRNVEYLARGLVNHVRMKEPYKEWVPGDLVEFSHLQNHYQPREGAEERSLSNARDHYLEEPVAHYTVGTKLTPAMVKDLKDLGYEKALTHDKPPPFEPEMRRAREALHHAPDWAMRMGGSGLKRNVMKAVQSERAPADPEDPSNVFGQLLFKGKPEEIDEDQPDIFNR